MRLAAKNAAQQTLAPEIAHRVAPALGSKTQPLEDPSQFKPQEHMQVIVHHREPTDGQGEDRKSTRLNSSH